MQRGKSRLMVPALLALDTYCVEVSANRMLRLVSAPLRASPYSCLHNPIAVLRNAASRWSRVSEKEKPRDLCGAGGDRELFPIAAARSSYVTRATRLWNKV